MYAISKAMLEGGVTFRKKPDDGNMKGLAFALDPDGYSIEIIKRSGERERKGVLQMTEAQ